MNKKQFIELLIRSYGLEPMNVEHYRTDGCDGQFQIATGWRGKAVDSNGDCVISFYEPDGFNMAVYEILRKASEQNLKPHYVPLPSLPKTN
jgi:hypothetical protein